MSFAHLDEAVRVLSKETNAVLRQKWDAAEIEIQRSVVPAGSTTLVAAACQIILVQRGALNMANLTELREDALQRLRDELEMRVADENSEGIEELSTPDGAIEWLEREGHEYVEEDLSANQKRQFANEWQVIFKQVTTPEGTTTVSDTQETTQVDAAAAPKERKPTGPMSEETKAIISAKLKEHYKTHQHPMAGKTYSEEAKANMKKGQAAYWERKRAEKAAQAAATQSPTEIAGASDEA